MRAKTCHEAQVGSQLLEFQWLDGSTLRVRLKAALDPNEPALMLEKGQPFELGCVPYTVAMFHPRTSGASMVRSGTVTI